MSVAHPIARSRGHERAWFTAAMAAAASLHVVIGLAIPPTVRHLALRPPPVVQVIDIDPVPPPPPPEPPAAAPAPAPPPRPMPAAPRPRAASAARPASPAPAPAAAVIALHDQAADSPVDLTDTMITGSAASYAGGTTMVTGIGTGGGAATAHAFAPSAPAARAAPAVDRTRRASPGDAGWRCAFPPEANAVDIDRAVVTLRVELDPGARVTGATVLVDPGYGFARAAVQCARARSWTGALDPTGAPTSASVVINIHFER